MKLKTLSLLFVALIGCNESPENKRTLNLPVKNSPPTFENNAALTVAPTDTATLQKLSGTWSSYCQRVSDTSSYTNLLRVNESGYNLKSKYFADANCSAPESELEMLFDLWEPAPQHTGEDTGVPIQQRSIKSSLTLKSDAKALSYTEKKTCGYESWSKDIAYNIDAFTTKLSSGCTGEFKEYSYTRALTYTIRPNGGTQLLLGAYTFFQVDETSFNADWSK